MASSTAVIREANVSVDPDCPDREDLARFILGQIADEDAMRVETHLARCRSCVETVETLAAEDALVKAVQSQRAAPIAPISPVVEVMMQRLSGLRPAASVVATEVHRLDESTDDEGPIAGRCEPKCTQDLYDFLSPPAGPDELGRLGQYRVRRLLGAGGMGVVFLAEDPDLKRPVALKVMRPTVAQSDDSRRRFLREAQAAAAIQHDHVVTIYHVGEERGIPFLAMQLLEGETLDERLKRGPKMMLREAVRIGREIANGLEAAHGRGLIHRDIKPANIWLERSPHAPREESGATTDPVPANNARRESGPPRTAGFPHAEREGYGFPHAEREGYRVKILDFGLARLAGDDAHLTQSGVIAGTPHYMAPEQARGEAVDPRSDLFSLGCVLYQMLTGDVPFPGRDTFSTLTALAVRDPNPPRVVNPEVPQRLSDLVIKLLAKQPNQRCQSARDVAAELGAIERDTATVAPSRPSTARRTLTALAAASMLLLLAWLGIQNGLQVHRFVTNRGQLVIETDDPDVELRVRGDGAEIAIHDAKTNRTVTLKAGRYEIELTDERDGLKISTSQFTIERGGRQIVKVWVDADSSAIREVRRFVGHADQVRSVMVSSDGRRAVSSGHDGKVRIWDVATGKTVRSFGVVIRFVSRVAFSPDDRRILTTGGDGVIRLWDAETGQEVRAFEGHTDQVHNAVFSPDGHRVLSGGGERDPTVRLWDVESGQEIHRFTGHTNFVWSVTFSPDGSRALTGAWDNTIRLWDLDTAQELRRFEGHADYILAVLFSSDGRRVYSAGRDTSVRIWDAETGGEIGRFEGHTRFVEALAISRDGSRLLSGGYDGTIRLWDTETRRELARIEFYPGAIYSLAFSPDGRSALSGGEDGTVRLWRLPETKSTSAKSPAASTGQPKHSQ